LAKRFEQEQVLGLTAPITEPHYQHPLSSAKNPYAMNLWAKIYVNASVPGSVLFYA
jgi:hypothetical protein